MKYKYHGNIKCDCTHKQKDHCLGEGWCKKCGCTWFYPNIRYIRRIGRKKACNENI